MDSKIRWGVIGAGAFPRRRMLPALHGLDCAQLVAVADVSEACRDAVQQMFGVQSVYASAEEMLSKEKLDAVYIASPAFLHREHALLCAGAGCNILLEKPIAPNPEEAAEIAEIFAQKGLQGAAGFMQRFHGLHRAFREAYSQGLLGRVVSLRAQSGFWGSDLGWRLDPAKAGGGALMDMGIHSLDLIGYLVGQELESAAAADECRVHDMAVGDTSCALARYGTGIPAYIDSYFCMRSEFPSTLEILCENALIKFTGTLGQPEVGKASVQLAEHLPEAQKQAIREVFRFAPPADYEKSMYAAEARAFCRVLAGETTPGEAGLCTLRQAADMQRTVQNAYLLNGKSR